MKIEVYGATGWRAIQRESARARRRELIGRVAVVVLGAVAVVLLSMHP
jgi:hypothetical protein